MTCDQGDWLHADSQDLYVTCATGADGAGTRKSVVRDGATSVGPPGHVRGVTHRVTSHLTQLSGRQTRPGRFFMAPGRCVPAWRPWRPPLWLSREPRRPGGSAVAGHQHGSGARLLRSGRRSNPAQVQRGGHSLTIGPADEYVTSAEPLRPAPAAEKHRRRARGRTAPGWGEAPTRREGAPTGRRSSVMKRAEEGRARAIRSGGGAGSGLCDRRNRMRPAPGVPGADRLG